MFEKPETQVKNLFRLECTKTLLTGAQSNLKVDELKEHLESSPGLFSVGAREARSKRVHRGTIDSHPDRSRPPTCPKESV